MPAPRRYPRKVHAPIPPPKTALAPPPPERPRMAWRREDGRGDLPEDLWALMQEGGRRLVDAPSVHRAAQLLALTEHAAFKTWVPGTPAPWANDPVEPPAEPAGGVSGGDWWDTPPEAPKASSDALERFAAEAHEALAASDWQPEDGGEVPRGETSKEWWE
jgi:hypothetical protein